MTCENCNGTGWAGDNGPGISGNNEITPCDCRKKMPFDENLSKTIRSLLCGFRKNTTGCPWKQENGKTVFSCSDCEDEIYRKLKELRK